MTLKLKEWELRWLAECLRRLRSGECEFCNMKERASLIEDLEKDLETLRER